MHVPFRLYDCMFVCLYALLHAGHVDIGSKGGKLYQWDGTGRIVSCLSRHDMYCTAIPRNTHTSNWPDGRATSSRSIYATDPSSRLALYPCSRLFRDRCSSRPPQQVVGRLEYRIRIDQEGWVPSGGVGFRFKYHDTRYSTTVPSTYIAEGA